MGAAAAISLTIWLHWGQYPDDVTVALPGRAAIGILARQLMSWYRTSGVRAMYWKGMGTWGSLWAAVLLVSGSVFAEAIDLAEATVVLRRGDRAPAEVTAASVLMEEVERRTGRRWTVTDRAPSSGPMIVAGAVTGKARWAMRPPRSLRSAEVLKQAEGFLIHTERGEEQTRIWILGADGPGVLYGVGHLLRQLDWRPDGAVHLPEPIEIATAPAYPIRGHQLGYRDISNTYDAFTVERYEQYVRELALFGANAIEQITFQNTAIP